MKKIVLSTIAMAAMMALTSYGQGIITFDTTEGSSVVSINGSAAQVDLNASLLYFNGTSYVDIVNLLLSDTTPTSGLTVSVPPATTQAAGGDISAYGNGILIDNSGNNYIITDEAASDVVSFEVEAWGGSASSYAVADATPGTLVGASAPFTETLSSSGSPENANIGSMPSFNLTPVPTPEPATLAFAGLGGLSMLLMRRRK